MKQIRHLFLVLVYLHSLLFYSNAEENAQFTLTLMNDLPSKVDISWENPEGGSIPHGYIETGEEMRVDTFPGHTFTYLYADTKYTVTAKEAKKTVYLKSTIANHNKISLTFKNELTQGVAISWEDESGTPHFQSHLPPSEELTLKTFLGHTFSYEQDGVKHLVMAERQNQYAVLLGSLTEVNVVCHVIRTAQREEEKFLVSVKPTWSPRGAARFLDLVREGYYNKSALFRVVPKFLTQFGIAADFETRTRWRGASILDDEGVEKVPFTSGMLSYAGSGKDSRSTEIFVVMPDTPQSQLEYFGTNSWETPFGVVQSVESSVVGKWFSYGDLAPWGDGPDANKIYEKDGYDYLKRDFPKMDYINNCHIVGDMEAFDAEEL